MYKKNEYYLNAKEYVQDLTDCHVKEGDSGYGWLLIWGYIIGVLLLARIAVEEIDSLGLALLSLVGIPAMGFYVAPKLYIYMTKDRAELEKKYKMLLDVIDSVAHDDKNREIDQAFVDLVLQDKIDAMKISEIRKLRKLCSIDWYNPEPDKLYDYANMVDACRIENGLDEKFAEYKAELKELHKAKQKELKRLESEKVKQNAKYVWKRVKSGFPKENFQSAGSLGQKRYLMLEKAYKEYTGIDEGEVICDGAKESVDEHLVDFISCYYLFKIMMHDYRKLKRTLYFITQESAYKTRRIMAEIERLRAEAGIKDEDGSRECSMSDELILTALKYMIDKNYMFVLFRSISYRFIGYYTVLYEPREFMGDFEVREGDIDDEDIVYFEEDIDDEDFFEDDDSLDEGVAFVSFDGEDTFDDEDIDIIDNDGDYIDDDESYASTGYDIRNCIFEESPFSTEVDIYTSDGDYVG